MRRSYILLTPILVVVAGFAVLAASQQDPVTQAGDDVPENVVPATTVQEPEFIGASRCRTCHRKEEAGAQYPKWEESRHSKAYMTLASDEAKAIATEKGIENPQTAAECLQCHVTAHGVPEERLGEKYSIEEGVGCESCHGAGGDYYKKSTMESIMAGETEGASVGLVTPDDQVCVGCHNEKSPTFKGFDFEEYSAKIAHPIPEATKAQYQ